MNINFNKIYLTREFSILKLTDDNEVDVAAVLELTSQVRALEEEYERKSKQYNEGFNNLSDLNTTYTILLNANTILKSEIEAAQQKLDTVQKIVDETDDQTKAEMNLLLYQTLLFRNYMFYNFAKEVYKHQEEKEAQANTEQESTDNNSNE